MPTYEYACRDCEHELEAVQSFTDDPLTVCPECGGSLRKKFSAAGIIFKGSGYYVTDSRAPAKTGGGSGDSSSGGDSSDASSSSSSGSSSSGSSSSGDGSSGTSSGSSSGTSSGASGSSEGGSGS